MAARKHIAIVGSGKIGSSVAEQLVWRSLGDIVLLDIIKGLPQGEALDLSHMASELGIDVSITGSNDYRDISGADLAIISAGLSRKPGMTRLDLLQKNFVIIREVAARVTEFAPNCKLLMVTNPMDVMTYVALKVTGFARKDVFGMGGMLDLSRFKYFLSHSLGISRSSIHAMVIGEHGDSMVPLPRYSTVHGVPVPELLSPAQLREAVENTKKIAAEVIALKGATIYAPAVGVARMVEAIVNDKRALLPASTYLDGEYGVKGICIGVPIVLSSDGVAKIIELKLNADERNLFMQSVEVLKQAVSTLKL